MQNQEIAQKLQDYISSGDYENAYDQLFDQNAVAIEPQLSHLNFSEVTGIEAIKQKVAALGEHISELFSRELSEPIVTNTHIAFTNIVHGKMKNEEEFRMSEICLYEVKNGKIVKEEFIY